MHHIENGNAATLRTEVYYGVTDNSPCMQTISDATATDRDGASMQVLTNSSLFCAEPLLLSENVSCPPPDPEGKPGPHGCGSNSWYINRYYKCFDGVADAPALVAARAEHAKAMAMLGATVGGVPPADPFDTAWEQVTASLGAAPGTVDIDVSKLTSPGTVVGVRYGQISRAFRSLSFHC